MIRDIDRLTARTFDVLVDDEKVATKTVEYHPTELLDAESARRRTPASLILPSHSER